MRKVLLYHKKNDLDRRIFPPTDYNVLWKEYGMLSGNAGNKLFIQACEQYLTKPDIQYSHLEENMTPEYINHNFDTILLPTANIFNQSKSVIRWLEKHTNEFNQYKIPVIALGAGAQANSYDELDDLCSSIKEVAQKFINAVYRTGGQFGLRGYFTQELFNRWGYRDAVVIGCPSFYQKGRSLTIQKKNISRDNFIPSINGELPLLSDKWWQKQFSLFPEAVYIDQNLFYNLLYNKKFHEQNKLSIKKASELSQQFTQFALQLIHEDRVKLFYDVLPWINYFSTKNVSFSIGQRIHGNIAAILGGVPAAVCIHDSRTRELSEFFEIYSCKQPKKSEDIFEIYCESDYTLFNKNYSKKFDNFEKFLYDYGISYDINDNEMFENKCKKVIWQEPEYVNQAYLEQLYTLSKRSDFFKYPYKVLKKLCGK